MADFKYLEKQEKLIEKKMAELDRKTENLIHESKIRKLNEKYGALLKRKKQDKLGYEDQILLDLYQDAIKKEKKQVK